MGRPTPGVPLARWLCRFRRCAVAARARRARLVVRVESPQPSCRLCRAATARIDATVLADTTPEAVCGWWRELREPHRSRHRTDGAGATRRGDDLAAAGTTENIERRDALCRTASSDDFLQRDPAKRSKAALERSSAALESLYGDIEREQRARIARWSWSRPADLAALALDERQRRQQDAVHLLRSGRVSARSAAKRPNGDPRLPAASRPIRRRATSYRRYAEGLVSSIAGSPPTSNGSTPAQRQEASRKLRSWGADLLALAADGWADRPRLGSGFSTVTRRGFVPPFGKSFNAASEHRRQSGFRPSREAVVDRAGFVERLAGLAIAYQQGRLALVATAVERCAPAVAPVPDRRKRGRGAQRETACEAGTPPQPIGRKRRSMGVMRAPVHRALGGLEVERGVNPAPSTAGRAASSSLCCCSGRVCCDGSRSNA